MATKLTSRGDKQLKTTDFVQSQLLRPFRKARKKKYPECMTYTLMTTPF